MSFNNKLKNKLISNKLFFLNVGDIVWCKRYKNELDKINIPEGHREGPYVILKKTNKYTYGIYCTSKNNNCEEYIEIKSKDLKKKTYIKTLCMERLTFDQYIKNISSLDDITLNYIKSILLKSKLKNLKIFKCKYSLGNIISLNNKLFYIYKKEKKKIYAFPIDKSEKSKNPIFINDKKYSFNFEGSKIINKKDKIKFIETSKSIEYILYKNLLHIKNKKDIVKRGDIIKYKENYYYIYGEEGYDWLVYDINEEIKKHWLISVSNKLYYTNYIKNKIRKSLNIEKVLSAKESEMDYIRDLRKALKC